MARKNEFIYKSLVSKVEKELLKDERRVISRAASVMIKNTNRFIESKGLVDMGNLLKGVKRQAYQHTVLVGISAPGYHAAIVEYGSDERYGKDGHGSGKMPAIPFFMPAYRLSMPKMKKILSEEW